MTSEASAAQYDEYFKSNIQPHEHPKLKIERYIKDDLNLEVDITACSYKDGVFGRVVYEAKERDKDMVTLDLWPKVCSGCARAANYEHLIRSLNSFDHENIVKYITFAYHDKALYGIRDYNEFKSLEQQIDPDIYGYNVDATEIVRQLVAGLSYLHAQKFYLGVLTPANVIVAGNDLVKIGGLLEFRTFYLNNLDAKRRERSSCADRDCASRYMEDDVIQFVAPEVLDRRPHNSFDLANSRGKADIWSVGMLALHMTGVDYMLPGDKGLEYYQTYAESGQYSEGEQYLYVRPEKFSNDTCFRIMQGCVRPAAHQRLSCECLESFLEDVPESTKLRFPFDPVRQSHSTDIAQLIDGLDDNLPICCRDVPDGPYNPHNEWLTPGLLRLLIAKRNEYRAPSCKEMDIIIRYMLHKCKKKSEERFYVVNSEATGRIFRKDDVKSCVNDESLIGLPNAVTRGTSQKEAVVMPFVTDDGYWKVLILDPEQRTAIFYDAAGNMKSNTETCLKPLSDAFKEHFDEKFNYHVGMEYYGMQLNAPDLRRVRNAQPSGWFVIYFLYLFVSKRKPEKDCMNAVHTLRMWLAELFLVSSTKWKITIPDVFLNMWAPTLYNAKSNRATSVAKDEVEGAAQSESSTSTNE